MSEQLLRNPDIEAESDVIADALGEANGVYLEFIEGLKSHDIDLAYRYYTDGKAWLGKGVHRWTGARGGQKEVTAFWLSIWDAFFRVSVFIPEKFREEALSLPINGEIKRRIDDSKQMGKLKFFPLIFDLRTDELFSDIYMLIDFRKRIK